MSEILIEAAACVAVASYCTYSFSDWQSVAYLTSAAFVLRTFIHNPELFVNKEQILIAEHDDEVEEVEEQGGETRRPSLALDTSAAALRRRSTFTTYHPTAAVAPPSASLESPAASSVVYTPENRYAKPRSTYTPSAPQPRKHRVPEVAQRKPANTEAADVASPTHSRSGSVSPFGRTKRHSRSRSSQLSQYQSASCGYDSDSSHASTSSGVSSTSTKSFGLPSYEKHSTVIVTLVPKRPGYIPQVQAILKAIRPYWLSLPGSVSHEIGHDTASGAVVVVETYESNDDLLAFEKSEEREKMLSRLRPFIDEGNVGLVRLPASSAATRLR